MLEAPPTLLDPKFLRTLDQLAFATRRLFTGHVQGEKRSPKRGSSVEFADFRDYVPGDDPRYVDWNAYGRLDRLLVKLFVEEEDLSVHILVDTSESMAFGEPTKFQCAQRLAAALAYLALTSFDRVRVAPFSAELGEVVGPYRGRAFAPRVFSRMEQWQPAGQTNLTRALRGYVQAVRQPGLVVVISDLFDRSDGSDGWGYEDGLRFLAGSKYEVVVLHLLDDAELAPPWSGDLKLVDAETGSEREVTMGQRTLRAYQRTLEEFLAGIEAFCSGRQISYTRVATSEAVEDVVLSLRRRGVVR
jgi:uncharacterized protein (DUF58 family)